MPFSSPSWRLSCWSDGVCRQGRGQNWEMPGSRKFWEARYLIIGLAIRKHLCKYIEAVGWSKWFRNSAKLFLWTPRLIPRFWSWGRNQWLQWQWAKRLAWSVLLQYASLLVPQLCWYSHKCRRSFDSVSDFARKNSKSWGLILLPQWKSDIYWSAPNTANLYQTLDSLRLALYFLLFTLPPHVAYNPQIINNFSQVISPAQQAVQIPKSVCTLLNEDATKRD